MSADWAADIARMHEHYGFRHVIDKLDKDKLATLLKFRIDFLQEELDELVIAKSDGSAADVVDALIDLCVVAIGTLDCFAVDSHEAWNRVLVANMNKRVGVKESRPNPHGLPDLIKPPGWEAPIHDDNSGFLGEAL